jgi:uncharacterized protein (TIGR03437 family)
MELNLAGLASGPVERVWYTEAGSLRIRTALQKVYETSDFEHWEAAPAGAAAPPAASGFAATLPEPDAHLRNPALPSPRVYAFGEFVYRSDDSGWHWENTTAYRGVSIIGEDVADLAVSPANENEIAAATGAGVFRSLDGGRTWHGLNESLPNLPAARLRAVPSADRGAQIELPGASMFEWQPGERRAWNLTNNEAAAFERDLRRLLEALFDAPVTAVARSDAFIYAGLADGRIAVSSNNLWSWTSADGRGPVNAIWIDPADPRIAVAVFGTREHAPGILPARVLRTFNGGSWDDISANLPDTPVTGVTADRASGAIYVATGEGIFLARTPLNTLGAALVWNAVGGLPQARVADVRLDAGGIQLWAALEGLGVYATLAPHRLGDPRVVSAADLLARAAAPGALFTVAGARLESANAGGVNVPVLAATDAETQIQIPFEVAGPIVALSATGPSGSQVLSPLPLSAAAPAILTDPDGTPWLLDADLGVRLDGVTPARSRMRVQILATGLGRVRPDWPSGVPAPFSNLPEVAAPVAAYLDREPVEVLRAVLAPGYTGVYLVEIEVPTLVDAGAAELHLEVAGQISNRVRVYVDPYF